MTQIKFGTDGWRAIIAEEFTYENVRNVSFAIARYVIRAERPQRGVVVGYDNRFGAERFARVAAETIAMTGTPVWLAEAPCPTPAISLLVRMRQAAAGVVITAGHHPYRWCGIKLKASYGGSASPAMVRQVEKELATVLRDGVPKLPPRLDLLHSLDARAPYLETLGKLVDWERLRQAGFRFLADPMHGSARGLLRELFTRHGIACDEIRGTRDPLFGGVTPEPIEPHLEALRQALRGGKYDGAFAADGDGDRIGAMDAGGTFVDSQQIFSLLFWRLAGNRELAGDLARTFSTTKMIDQIAVKFGRKVWETRIGFEHIGALMLERDILIGGDESGGIATRLFLPERDATVNSLLLAEVMAWQGKPLGELVAMLQKEFGPYYHGHVDLELRPGQKEKAMAHFSSSSLKTLLDYPVARREDLDGIRLYFGDRGWAMVRPSGAEPMLSLCAETSDARLTRRILDQVSTFVQSL